MAKETTVEGSPTSFDPSKASLDDLRGQLAAPAREDRIAEEELTPEAEAPVTEEPETEEPEVATTEEEPEVETPAVEEEPETETVEEEEERLKKMRLRPRSNLDQQVMDLYRSEGFEGTLQDATDVIYRRQPAPTEETPRAEAPVDPLAAERTQLETLNTELKELETKLDSASEELDTATALKLQRELLRKESEVGKIENRIEAREREINQSVQNTQRTLAEESRDRALERFPALNDADSVERKRFDAFIRTAQDDPVQAPIFNSPLWPEIMAARFADEGNLKATKAAPAVPAATPRKATGTHARQVTTGEPAGPANPQVTPELLRKNMGKMSRDDLEAMLAGERK